MIANDNEPKTGHKQVDDTKDKDSQLPNVGLTSITWDEVLKVAELGTELGLRASELRRIGLQENNKLDGSVLTNADLELSATAEAALPLIRPAKVLSEENVKEIDVVALAKDKEYWMIDPIDGTASFVEGYDGYCVCLALMQEGRPVIGVIAVPERGVTYIAAEGMGAFSMNHTDDSLTPLNATPPDEAPFRFGGFYNYTESHQEHLDIFFEKNGISKESFEAESAALKYCRVADGSLHMGGGWSYLEAWDIAAADIIVHEAGGRFINMVTGMVFQYDPELTAVHAPMAIARDLEFS